MVNTMIGRRHEHPLEPAQLGNVAGMHPELIQQIERRDADEHQQWHAQHCQRQVENPAEQKAGAGLAQGRGEVVFLTLVMDRMRRPQHVALVPHAVQPVVTEVIEYERKHPHPWAVGRKLQQRQMLKGKRVSQQADALGQQAAGGRQHAGAQAVDRIGQAIRINLAPTVSQQLNGNQHKEERHGVQNQIHGVATQEAYYQRLGPDWPKPYGSE